MLIGIGIRVAGAGVIGVCVRVCRGEAYLDGAVMDAGDPNKKGHEAEDGPEGGKGVSGYSASPNHG